MMGALWDEAPAELEWNLPQGGYYIWCKLPEGVTAQRLMVKAAEEGVAFIPGDAFYVGSGGERQFRLSFSRCSLEVINEGIARLCRVLKDLLNETWMATGEKSNAEEITPLI